MIDRCENPNAVPYKNYGGRGIKVCARWRHSFDAFVEDMGERFPGGTLERADNDADYGPSNCHWATRIEQVYNRRNTRRIQIDGLSFNRAELAEAFGLPLYIVTARHKRGWSPEEIIGRVPRVRPKPVPTERQIENWQRKRSRTHCAYGHEFTPANTMIESNGYRKCRECVRARQQAKRKCLP